MKFNAFVRTTTRLSFSLYLLSIFPSLPLAQTITYYSDVPLYTSLVQCAATGCNVGLSLIYNCGSTSPVYPYASCACLKDQNSADIATELTDAVQVACGSTATEDVSSVLAVFHSWCQAVAPSKEAKVTATAAATGATATPGNGVAAPSSTSTSTSGSPANPSASDASSGGPSGGQWAAIGVGLAASSLIVGSLAALCAGWTRPEQFGWILTCGVKGSRHRKPKHERNTHAGINGGDRQGMQMGPVGRDRGGGQGGDGHPAWVQGGGRQGQGQWQGH